jgi:glycosyltransferase involved in cell wall biosynthesis
MLNHTPLVSIITITRNRGYLIHRAIKSILAQTYTNIEYIIVDGASTDNTKEVVSSFQDKRINYIYLDNYGPTLQTKIGFENSNGKYVTFLDDDDEYLSTKIEKQVSLIESLSIEYGFVYCWMSYFDFNTLDFLYIHKTQLRGHVAVQTIEKPVVSGTPTFLFRRDVYNEFGGSWKDNIGLSMSDWEFAARVCQKYLVDYVPESLVKVYINHGSIRLSDGKSYSDVIRKTILFHNHFLKEFKTIFDKYPKMKRLHLKRLVIHHIKIKENKQAWKRYRELMQCSFSVYNLFFYPLFFIKCLFESKNEY